MNFIISGDTHGIIDIGKIVKFFDEHEDEYTSEDYLVVCGDIGVCGFSISEEAETRSVFRSLPVTTLFVDGNHENFKQLNAYDVDIWNGGKVHFIENEIIHLMRGHVSLHLVEPIVLIICIARKDSRGFQKRYLIKMNMKKDGIILKKQILKLIIF